MYKKAFLIPIIALTLLSYLPLTSHPIMAVSPSPSLEPNTINEVTENLKKRLQDSLENEDDQQNTPYRAYVGKVKDVIKDTLIVEDKDGKKDVKILDGTTIIRTPGNATIKSDNIRIDDYIIAIGNLTEDEIMDGKRLIVSVNPISSPTKATGIGSLAAISKNSLTLRVGEQDLEVYLTAKTITKTPNGTIELSDLAIGDTLIYTAVVDSDEDLTATILMKINPPPIEQ